MSNWAPLIGILFVLGSCTIKKLTTPDFSLPVKNPEDLVKRVNDNKSEVEWINVKGKLRVMQKDREFEFGINIKNKKDSVVWVSARGPFGVEILRMQMTPDSICLINRINKTYVIKSASQIKEITDLTFYDLQDIIAANLKTPRSKYTMKSDLDNAYILEGGSWIYSITKDYKVQRVKIFDSKNIIQIAFDTYNNNDHFPRKISIKSDAEEFFDAIISYSKVEVNKPQKPVFKIPKSYNETN